MLIDILLAKVQNKDIEKAIDLYEESAKLGNWDANLALGNIYEKGIGIKVDLDMASYFYKAAAQLKHPYALFKAGQFIEKGIGQYKSQEEANEQMFIFYK